jgi:hypothetical protein
MNSRINLNYLYNQVLGGYAQINLDKVPKDLQEKTKQKK